MGRPSPRTLGKTTDPETGEEIIFTKFGTQQLKYVAPPKLGTPYQGVRQIDTGGVFKGFTQSIGFNFGSPTLNPNVTIAKASSYVPPTAFPTQTNGKVEDKCHLDDDKPFCGFTELMGGEVCECPNWFSGETTDPTAGGRGCECEACKNGTGQCDASVPQCDAWDLGCIATGGKVEETFNWIKIILIVIGIGVLLWLLRPLFGMIGAFKGGSP